MAGRSKVFDMTPELRAVLDKLLRDGVKLDEIVVRLEEMAGDPEALPSRSSIHRYSQRQEQLTRRAKESREIADRLVDAMGPQAADGKGVQAMSQVLQALVFETMGNLPDGESFDPENLMMLARTIGGLASAQKTNADFVAKVRLETQKEAAKKLDAGARSGEIDAEAVAAAKRIMGFDA